MGLNVRLGQSAGEYFVTRYIAWHKLLIAKETGLAAQSFRYISHVTACQNKT